MKYIEQILIAIQQANSIEEAQMLALTAQQSLAILMETHVLVEP